VYAQTGVVNRDFEGDVRNVGDTVHIISISEVTIGDYTKNTTINAPSALTDAERTLVVDQAHYFNFSIDDIDRLQGRPDLMDEAMNSAAFGLRNKADAYIASLHTGVAAGNTLGDDTDPLEIDDDEEGYKTVYNTLVDLSVKLDESNTPGVGRWVVVPPFIHGVLRKDNRFIATGAASDNGVKYNSMIGEIAGFRVLVSNNVPKTAGTGGNPDNKYKIIAGHASAISYAEQIMKMEAYRPDDLFADALKGLFVYGAKLIRPAQIAVATMNRPA